MKHCRHRLYQPQQIFTALVLTSILSVSASITLLESATASVLSSQGIGNISDSKQPRPRELPSGIVNAVRRDLSDRTGIPRGQLRVVNSSPETWSDSCLGLGEAHEICAQMLVEGWRVVMTDGSKKWVYRTDNNGSVVRLEKDKSPDNPSGELPRSLANTVLQTASQRTGLPTSQLRIVKAEQMIADGCLGLGGPDEACIEIAQTVWEVTVEARQQRLVYRIDTKGSQIRLNREASSINDSELPKSVANRVLQLASELLKLPVSQFEIKQAEMQTWNNSCLDLQRPEERCRGDLTEGWRVTLAARGQRLVYHTNEDGTVIRLNEEASNITSNLPDSVAKAVVRDASTQLNVPNSRIRIVGAQRKDWPDGCLGIPDPLALCTMAIVPGWRVTVEGGQRTLVYRTNDSGSVIKLEGQGNPGNGGAVPIPQSELPPPLKQREVFRAITSGGIAGISYQTTLMNDGRVIRVELSRNNNSSSQREIRQISQQQVQRFEQLLKRQNFDQFNQLQFPAPRGAADYFTVTLTSKDATTRYADIGSDQLPESLQAVIESWNQIAN